MDDQNLPKMFEYLASKLILPRNNSSLDEKIDENLISDLKILTNSIYEKKLSLLCLNPALGFKRIYKTFGKNSIVNFMSGTLSPFDFYEFQLRTNFNKKISTKHIITQENLNILFFTKPLLKNKNSNIDIFSRRLTQDFNEDDQEHYNYNNHYNYDLDLEENQNNFTKNNNISISKNCLEKLKFSYENMKNEDRKNLLFMNVFKIIFDFSKICHSGNLVFVKSYDFNLNLKQFIIEELKNKSIPFKRESYDNLIEFNLNIYDQEEKDNNIQRKKKEIKIEKICLFFDCISKNNIKNDLIEQYKASCTNKNIKNFLFTVMRGTLSEGVNFKNHESTSVYIIGVPFSNFTDHKIKIKQKYLNEKHSEYSNFKEDHFEGFSDTNFNTGKINLPKFNTSDCRKSPINGYSWYCMDAINCVNQAIGRSIRSMQDYASIILIDEQFLQKKNSKYFSKWIDEFEKVTVDEYNYQKVIRKSKIFFEMKQ